jgi:hypothetical protein
LNNGWVVPIECPLVGCVSTHPTKCDRVHLAQESAEGAIANVTSLGGDRNANTVAQNNDYDQMIMIRVINIEDRASAHVVKLENSYK